MRLSRILAAANWRYAVGEIFLIVVGVTIALAANSWFEGRELRRDELAVLQEIRATLSEDLEAVTEAFNTIRQVDEDIASLVNYEDIASLVNYVESGEPYSDEVARSMRSLTRFVLVTIRSGPFETLKARGLSLISSESLRAKLTSLYEDEFPQLEKNSDIDRLLSRDRILPYVLANFRLKPSGDWVPNDYEVIRANSGVITLGRYRSGTLRRFYLPSFERTMALMREILTKIDNELREAAR